MVEPKVRRVALIDTLQDEKFEAIRVAEALGKDLYAVRLDTPSSRRGDFFRILEEVRWELNLRGFDHVKIVASGGIDEYEILHLNPVVDCYGVGTSIANAPVLYFALDIMEIEGRPMAKRGKRSGAKEVWRRRGHAGDRGRARRRAGARAGGALRSPLLKPLVTGGRIVRDLPPPRTIRDFVLEQLGRADGHAPAREGCAAITSGEVMSSVLDGSSPTSAWRWPTASAPRHAPSWSAGAPGSPPRATSTPPCARAGAGAR